MALILFRILWGLLLAFVVLCMVKAIMEMHTYDEATDEVERLRSDLSATRWLLLGWIVFSLVWAIVRYV